MVSFMIIKMYYGQNLFYLVKDIYVVPLIPIILLPFSDYQCMDLIPKHLNQIIGVFIVYLCFDVDHECYSCTKFLGFE